MSWPSRLRKAELAVIYLRAELATARAAHDVVAADAHALEDHCLVLQAEVEDWQVRWGEAVAERDKALAEVETYARALRAVQQEVPS